ncbi:MAG: sugar transferase [Aulosira sp. DedQUE10]|nr:sugar transferase [Aulosira sp. DedQUE10]
MTISIIPSLQNPYKLTEQHQADQSSPYCTLLWRQGQLLVKSPKYIKQPYLPSLDDKQWLVECLKHSPVRLVSIDATLGEDLLRFWAEACEAANKPIFLRLPSVNQRLKKGNSFVRLWKRLVDWVIAFVLLVVLSPVMLGLVLLMQVDSPGSLFSFEWLVGERGKVFRAIKFRTIEAHNVTPLRRSFSKSGLHNFPQLWNVLQGDRGLVRCLPTSRSASTHCWTLADAVQLSSPTQQNLNAASEMIGSWQVEATFKPAES